MQQSTGASSQLYITILNYTLLGIVVKVSQAAHTNCAVRCCVLVNLSWQPTTHLQQHCWIWNCEYEHLHVLVSYCSLG